MANERIVKVFYRLEADVTLSSRKKQNSNAWKWKSFKLEILRLDTLDPNVKSVEILTDFISIIFTARSCVEFFISPGDQFWLEDNVWITRIRVTDAEVSRNKIRNFEQIYIYRNIPESLLSSYGSVVWWFE